MKRKRKFAIAYWGSDVKKPVTLASSAGAAGSDRDSQEPKEIMLPGPKEFPSKGRA